MPDLTPADYPPEVATAIAILDQLWPGKLAKVDVEAVEMSSFDSCVLCLVAGTWNHGRYLIDRDISKARVNDAITAFFPDARGRRLAAWTAEIRRRQGAT